MFLMFLMLSNKNILEYSKLSPVECGYMSSQNYQMSFSLHFFSIGLIFLIFDIELIFMFPFLFFLSSGSSGSFLYMMFIFLMLGGLVYEWNQGSLEWTLI